MQRDGDNIIFNATEQHDFDVPAVTTAENALDIAEGYHAAAERVIELVNQERLQDPVDSEPDMLKDIDLQARIVRAQNLIRFSYAIQVYCAPEVVERLISDLNG